MNNFLQKRWHPFFIWALIIFLASSNPDPLIGLSGVIENKTIFCFPLIDVISACFHLLTYAILTIFLIRALIWRTSLTQNKILVTFLIVVLYALANEFYQTLIPAQDFNLSASVSAGWGSLMGLVGYVYWHMKPTSNEQEQDLLL